MEEKIDVKTELERCKKDPIYFIENYVESKVVQLLDFKKTKDEKIKKETEKRILKVLLEHAEKLEW